MREARLTSDLPEHLARLYDPSLEKFETPLDDRGIADIDQLVELALWTYPEKLPSFYTRRHNRHHVYWTESWWKDYAASQTTAANSKTVMDFREGAPQIVYVPLEIHRWIEESQIPPPAPSLEIMRRRNAAWASAVLLLKGALEVDQARNDYTERRNKPRRVLGSIVGITPVSKQQESEFIDVIDNEYWLSELNARLKSWHYIADQQGDLPTEHGFLATPRLSDVRHLRSRLRKGAIVPKLPESLLAQVA